MTWENILKESDDNLDWVYKLPLDIQWKIIQMKYLQDMFQVDIADELEVTQPFISQQENLALETICNKTLLIEKRKIVLHNKCKP